jgi:mRNA interferase YafQ
MREVEYTTQFERDYKREKKSNLGKDLDLVLKKVLELLSSDKQLPLRLKEHPLRGEYFGTRECHIKPDLLLIYEKRGKSVLVLIRLGSHSELFS